MENEIDGNIDLVSSFALLRANLVAMSLKHWVAGSILILDTACRSSRTYEDHRCVFSSVLSLDRADDT